MAFIRQIRDAITGERRFSAGSNRILASSTCKSDRLSFLRRRCFMVLWNRNEIFGIGFNWRLKCYLKSLFD